ncbi:MAG: T9SS type A sorting domain-containing protein [Bacteroidales bacterium]|nr:T9SS type A sorting domain-containing protein [Bacteroidales bacterium]
MKAILFTMLFLFSFLGEDILAQNTFVFELNYPTRKESRKAIEDEEGNIYALISEATGVDYAPSTPTKSYLLKFNPNGDTSTIQFNLGDTLFRLSQIVKDKHNGYYLLGYAQPVEEEEVFLVIIGTDSDFNQLWTKYHLIGNYFRLIVSSVFEFEDAYMLLFRTCDFPCTSSYLNFTWMDTTGMISDVSTFEYRTQSMPDYLLSPDSSQLWVFSMRMVGFYGSWPVRMVFDTSFQYIDAAYLPDGSHANTSVRWISDATFLYSYIKLRPNSTSNDHEMYLMISDTSLNAVHYDYYGEQNSKDVCGFGSNNIDFISPDSIFFIGYRNQKVGIPEPGRVSWLMTGQTDKQLQTRYFKYFGGDRYYDAFYVLATRDGGSFICGSWYDHDTHIFNPIFLKLNEEGLITASSETFIKERNIAFWPVPFSSQLNYQSVLPFSSLQLYDNMGRLVYETIGRELNGSIAVDHLDAGIYHYKVTFLNNILPETGRIIKTR